MATASRRGVVLGSTAALLLVLPWLTYWSAIFRRYGMRDDYAILREAMEEPGKILRVCASFGRPLYGALLELSMRGNDSIGELSELRLLGVACLGLFGAAVFLLLVREGWSLVPAALLAAFLPLTPSAQVIASWGICWPQAVALLLGAGAFALAPRRWPLAVLAMAMATLTYQISGLIYAVLVAAALVARRETSLADTGRWLARHLGIMGLGLGTAFVITQFLFKTGLFLRSPRIVFETRWLDKAAWVLTHVFPNALALSALNSSTGTPPGYPVMVALSLAILGVGIALEGRRAGLAASGRWLLGLVLLSAAAYSVSFLAGERWPTYRTLFALTGVCGVFFAASLVNLGACWPGRGPRIATGVLGGLVALSAWLAHRQTLELFAEPQGRELALMEEGARQVVPSAHPRVFVLTALQNDTSAPQRYLDEFGSVSVDTEWVAKEMWKAVLRERFPRERDVSRFYRFATGRVLPERRQYDILVDMRRMRRGG
ncbi:hypothetical protein [Melittangium boletus]|uniref:Glycosyltransferase RgtA/B/C/D-like domain-containing protein n=1 Tax=Melittangium boletus DSM 14713 TaxID=1294270 RepID=A0A250IA59_9BACT|nr:hypothetical protein [Melittangium boletus]ATB28090.1 hypothetical protein MEBOL_001535 [Melittangium boletus DSM 14713]